MEDKKILECFTKINNNPSNQDEICIEYDMYNFTFDYDDETNSILIDYNSSKKPFDDIKAKRSLKEIFYMNNESHINIVTNHGGVFSKSKGPVMKIQNLKLYNESNVCEYLDSFKIGEPTALLNKMKIGIIKWDELLVLKCILEGGYFENEQRSYVGAWVKIPDMALTYITKEQLLNKYKK